MSEKRMSDIQSGDNTGWANTLNENVATFNDFAKMSNWAKGDVRTDSQPVGINGCTVDGWSYTPYYLNGQVIAYLIYLTVSNVSSMGGVDSAVARIGQPFKGNKDNIIGGFSSSSSNASGRGYHGVKTGDGKYFYTHADQGFSQSHLSGLFLLLV